MISLESLSKSFHGRKILDNIDLELSPGISYAIVGRSGEGKSTLLHLLGALDMADQGHVFLENKAIDSKNSDEFRKSKIGSIFQNFNVLEDFSVLDNLRIACKIRQHLLSDAKLLQALDDVGLLNVAKHMARTLSGGEKQRLAIARALVHKPKIVLADEPTGSLDQASAEKIHTLLLNKVTHEGALLIIVTHDLELAQKCDRILQLKDGKLRSLK
jgi:ABC-type lipoprotein export system ATPase subunit